MRKDSFRVKESDIQSFLGLSEVPEELLQYVGLYEIQQWTFGEREQIIGSSSEQTVGDNGKVVSKLNPSKFRTAVIENCLKKTPLGDVRPTKRYISDMPVWLGEAIWEKVNALNSADVLANDEAKKFTLS